jgi:cytochrome c biogenesis protein CcmG, thiol:disulfide interchange protein DsbE
MSETTVAVPETRSRLRTLIPLLIFLMITVFLGIGLTMDPRLVPSPLIDKAVPEFDLPPVRGRELGLANTDLVGEVALVNVFASWCTACREEHPLLMRLAATKAVPVHGLNYKDAPADAARWLDEQGDPYTRTGADINGRVGIDWGVYGVPETFIIDQNGNIAYKHIGAIKQDDWEATLLPHIQRLQGRK